MGRDLESTFVKQCEIRPIEKRKQRHIVTALELPAVGPADAIGNDEHGRGESGFNEVRNRAPVEISEAIVESDRYGVGVIVEMQ
jgi:hypothetical protein